MSNAERARAKSWGEYKEAGKGHRIREGSDRDLYRKKYDQIDWSDTQADNEDEETDE